jgi:hypothetical protein
MPPTLALIADETLSEADRLIAEQCPLDRRQ